MQLNLITDVAAIIHNGYDGGLIKFSRDGGMFEVLPTENRDIIVIHPDLPDDLKKALTEFGHRIHSPVKFDSHLNFEGCDPDEIHEGFVGLVMEDLMSMGLANQCLVSPSPVILTLAIQEDLSKDQMFKIREAVTKRIPGLVRGLIVAPNSSLLFVAKESDTEALPKQVVMLNDRPQRDRPIGQDDVVNLKIALESGDVNDFINSL